MFLDRYNPTWVQLLGGSNVIGGAVGMERENRNVDEGHHNIDHDDMPLARNMPEWYTQDYDPIRNVDLQLPHRGDENERRLPTSVIVAQYLQKIMPIRFGILHNLIEGPRANANPGMAVFVDPAERPAEGVQVEPGPPDEGNDDGDIDDRGGIVAASAD